MSNQKNPAQKSIVFEQPLNERIRTFMRIEHLSTRCNYCLDQTTPWGSHLSLSALIELINLISRGDLKQEILKELSRQLNTLDGFVKTEKIDRGKLQDLIDTHEQLISEMSAINGQLLLSTKKTSLVRLSVNALVFLGAPVTWSYRPIIFGWHKPSIVDNKHCENGSRH